MQAAHSLDVRAIREEHKRTHTGPGQREAHSLNRGCSRKVDCTDEEAEFAVAMDRYKRVNHRPYPTCAEVLAVLKALGYRKDA